MRNSKQRFKDFLKKKTLKFLGFVTEQLEIQEKAKLHPLDILQNCVTPLENSKAKTLDLRKFHMILSRSSLEIPLPF